MVDDEAANTPSHAHQNWGLKPMKSWKPNAVKLHCRQIHSEKYDLITAGHDAWYLRHRRLREVRTSSGIPIIIMIAGEEKVKEHWTPAPMIT